jgi:hypothetical protein
MKMSEPSRLTRLSRLDGADSDSGARPRRHPAGPGRPAESRPARSPFPHPRQPGRAGPLLGHATVTDTNRSLCRPRATRPGAGRPPLHALANARSGAMRAAVPAQSVASSRACASSGSGARATKERRQRPIRVTRARAHRRPRLQVAAPVLPRRARAAGPGRAQAGAGPGGGPGAARAGGLRRRLGHPSPGMALRPRTLLPTPRPARPGPAPLASCADRAHASGDPPA